MPAKKVLGLPRPVFLVLVVVILGLSILSILAGAVGQSILHIHFPSWLSIAKPVPSLPAEPIFNILGFTITNTILAAWVTIAFLVLVSLAISRRLRIIPGRVQAAAENLFTWVYDLCVQTAGEKNGRRFFPLVMTIFLFVITNALLNFIPGFSTILITNSAGEQVPLLRGANTDLNLPLALALITFVTYWYWGIQSTGLRYFGQFFDFGPLWQAITHIKKEGVMGLFTGVIAAFVGILEFLLQFVRVISLTFRLFGNMIGGEILTLILVFLIPFVFSDLISGLELFFGFVQALIFASLALVFATLAVTPHYEEEHAVSA